MADLEKDLQALETIKGAASALPDKTDDGIDLRRQKALVGASVDALAGELRALAKLAG